MNDKLFNPDYLKHLCQKYGLRPSRKYGQNFLISEEPIEKIIEAADLKKADTIVEVGPGFGVLTFALAEKAGKVIAYEIEKKLQSYWQESAPNNVQIKWGNILKIDKPEIKDSKYKVVANLPYQITSSVIRNFLESDNPPETMVLMVQKEVGERICAKKGEMSVLSVAVQYYGQPEVVAIVERDNFWPVPKVDSAIIKIERKHLNKDPEFEKNFFKIVKVGFANKRKLLIKNLFPIFGKENKEKLKKTFAELGLKETVRAQELGVEEWKKLTRLFFLTGLR